MVRLKLAAVTAALLVAGAVTAPASAAPLTGSQELIQNDGDHSGCVLTLGRAFRVKDKHPEKRFVVVTSKLDCDTAYDRAHWGVFVYGGTSYTRPHDWHYGKASYRVQFDSINVGTTNLRARIACNWKVNGKWVYPTTGFNIQSWAEVHSPIHAPLSERFHASIHDYNQVGHALC